MEWLLLLLILALPVVRFLLLPARAVGQLRRLPLGSFAAIGAVLVAGWFIIQAINSPEERTARYSRGDAQMRALLE
jgi:hypothetical protein